MRAVKAAGVLVGMILVAACGSDQSATAVAPAERDIVFDFRQVAVVNQVGDEFTVERASEGGQLVVVEYAITNSGRLPVPAYDIPAIRIFDRAGVAYAPDAGLTAALSTQDGVVSNNKLVSDLNPGITTQGAEVFEVSREAWRAGGWQLGWDGATVADLSSIEISSTTN